MSSRFRELLQKLLEEHEGQIAVLRRSATPLEQVAPCLIDAAVQVTSLLAAKHHCDADGPASLNPTDASGRGDEMVGRQTFGLPGEVQNFSSDNVETCGDDLLRQTSKASIGHVGTEQSQIDFPTDMVEEQLHKPRSVLFDIEHTTSDRSSAHSEESLQHVCEQEGNDSHGPPLALARQAQSKMSLASAASAIELNEAWLAPISRGTTRKFGVASSSESHLSGGEQQERPTLGRRTVVDVTLRKAYALHQNAKDPWFLQSLISSPSSPKRLVWDVLGLLMLTYDMVMVPMQLFELDFDDFLEVMNIVTCSFWTMDLLASFFVGYYTSHKVELRFKLIAKHYMKSWFAMDVTLVVTDWALYLAGGVNSNARLVRVGKIARGMRVFRLLRMLKFHAVIDDLMDRIHSEYHRTLLGIVKLLLLIIAVNHFVACIWYGIGNARDDMTWIKAFFVSSDGLGYRYWTSMHWSLTQFTPASMEVVPRNSLERFFAVCTLLVAMVTFSSFVSTITNSMTQLRKLNSEENAMYAKLHKFFGEHNVSDELVHTILRYLKGHKARLQQGGRSIEQDVVLLKVLPEELKTELRLEVHMPTVRIHPLLYNYELVDPFALQHVIRVAVSEKALLSGEEHLALNNEIKHMVMVKQGQLDYSCSFHGASMRFKIGTGQWACEAALWAKSPEAFAPLVTKAPSVILLIESVKFIAVVRRYEESFKYVKRYAKLFVEYMNEEVQDCQWVGILCNNFDSIRDVVQRAFDDAIHHEQLQRKGAGRGLTRSLSTIHKIEKKKTGLKLPWRKHSTGQLL